MKQIKIRSQEKDLKINIKLEERDRAHIKWKGGKMRNLINTNFLVHPKREYDEF